MLYLKASRQRTFPGRYRRYWLAYLPHHRLMVLFCIGRALVSFDFLGIKAAARVEEANVWVREVEKFLKRCYLLQEESISLFKSGSLSKSTSISATFNFFLLIQTKPLSGVIIATSTGPPTPGMSPGLAAIPSEKR